MYPATDPQWPDTCGEECMRELRADSGYTAVGTTSRRPAHLLATVVLLGMAVFAGLIALPSTTSNSTTEPSGPERAIGGGPRAEPTGTLCHGDDGATYEAERCSSR